MLSCSSGSCGFCTTEMLVWQNIIMKLYADMEGGEGMLRVCMCLRSSILNIVLDEFLKSTPKNLLMLLA